MLQIYDSMTCSKRAFKPIEPGKIRMYVCGITVYDYCHIGHARVMVGFDVITRYLRTRGYEVTYIRNITDVDDKILQRADEAGIPFPELTEKFINAMHEDEDALGVLRPDQEPRATDHMDDITNMIGTLMEKGFAYQADNNDIYYEISKFENYGQLSRKNTEDLISGARVEVETQKRSPLDFVLWKSAKPGEASWPSPWGDGRPGWHIECSAMSTCCLGDTFDIHGGGPDLRFPHHENEIAQSEAATGKTFANLWMHAGAVRVDQEKMSKSLGNFFTIREVLEKYQPEVIRYLLIASHYRSPINYSDENLKNAEQSLTRLYTALQTIEDPQQLPTTESGEYLDRFHEAMEDDFNTPEALAVMFDLARNINKAETTEESRKLGAELKTCAEFLGILQVDPETFLKSGNDSDLSAETIEELIKTRNQARADKDWVTADRVRDELVEQGIQLNDAGGETSWTRAR
ncbi:MAG: cysteine--tRNA ligase [Pseudomonadales bacterium]|nr:cysteine--tRNA ligase [Pseudomonadales bacterium]